MRRLSREVRVPGFRPGKVPRRVIEARMGGAAALRGEAIREALPDFYAQAVTDTEVDPIDQPEIDITSGDESGPVSFDAVVHGAARRWPSPATRGWWSPCPTSRSPTRRSTRRSTACGPPRASWSRWPARPRTATRSPSTSTARGPTPASGDDGDLDAEDYLYEVGSGTRGPRARRPAAGGQGRRHLHLRLDHRARPDQTVSFRVLVKDVKELVLPEVDRRVGVGGVRVRHGRGAAGRHRRAAAPAARRPGPDGPPAEDGRGAGRAGHRGDPRAAGGWRSCASGSTTSTIVSRARG